MRTLCVMVLASALAACGDDGGAQPSDGGTDAVSDGDVTPDAYVAPMTLADTGLCTDAACTTIAAGILDYAPQYQLFADGATKRRWISLPTGTTIDSSNMDFWKFPVGTRVWKEFAVGGKKIETRYIEKLAADDSKQASWFYASFAWNDAGDSTTLASPQDGVQDANGTTHDIPSRQECKRCHDGVTGRILGVNAMSLDYVSPTTDLTELVASNLLSVPPAAPTSGTTFFPLPGSPQAKAAFGYMHANCGGCHNPTSGIYTTLTSNMVLRLETSAAKRATEQDVPAYATTVNLSASLSSVPGKLVDPTTTDNSVVLVRMKSLVFPTKMPEIGTETQDAEGIAAVTAWINTIP